MELSRILQAADAALAAECDASSVRLYLSESCLNRSKCWHTHWWLSPPFKLTNTHMHIHTNTPINWGDKWRGVKIHHCLNTKLTEQQRETLSSPPSSFFTSSTPHLHNTPPPQSLALSLVCNPVSSSPSSSSSASPVHRRGMCQFDHIISFPSSSLHQPPQQPLQTSLFLSLPLHFVSFGVLAFSLCVYFCLCVLAKAACFHYFQLGLEIFWYAAK